MRGFESLILCQKTPDCFRSRAFFIAVGRDSNRSNARLRWSLACRRLDGGNTYVFSPPGRKCKSNPSSSAKNDQPLSWLVIFYYRMGYERAVPVGESMIFRTHPGRLRTKVHLGCRKSKEVKMQIVSLILCSTCLTAFTVGRFLLLWAFDANRSGAERSVIGARKDCQ